MAQEVQRLQDDLNRLLLHQKTALLLYIFADELILDNQAEQLISFI